ncbi:fibropellin-1-like [Lytechinus pictus]|uniref:fibropellin-1-like n=1 Tax=Lytechinus pictus TaxID=7653 RepID=UPI0030BA14DE
MNAPLIFVPPLSASLLLMQHIKVVTIIAYILQLRHSVNCDGTCAEIPRDICPHEISEHTGEPVKFVPKLLTRDHPEYDVRTPKEARDKMNLYCAHPDCYSSPCHNGGTCVEELDGFSCICLEEYFGVQCEQHVCYSSPCLNGGTCVEELDGFSCICLEEYFGVQCEQHAFSACYSKPCYNGGTCVEEFDGFSCICLGGYVGFQCEQHDLYLALSACFPDPCYNGGLCVEEFDGFSCSCLEGYFGVQCEQHVCPEGWVYGQTKCFLILYNNHCEDYDWLCARDACNILSPVTLVTGQAVEPSLLFIESVEEYNLLKPHVTLDYAWINCHSVNGYWYCYTDASETTSPYRAWDTAQPNGGTDEEYGLIFMSNGKMHDCTVTLQNPVAIVCQVILM